MRDFSANMNALFSFSGGPIKQENKTKEPEGPISFLNSYYESDEFKRKSGSEYDLNMMYYKKGSSVYKPEFVEKDKDGSWSVPAERLIESKLYEERGEPTITLDKSQAKEMGYSLINDVLPHEYSHTTRNVGYKQEEQFIQKHKNNLVKDLFEKYKSDPSGLQSGKSFSDWGRTILDHSEKPAENYADLNSLRWNMYKYGIYDVRKRQMTVDDLNKVIKNPALKNNALIKRLLSAFRPEDIVNLNNTIASSELSNNNQT